MEPLPSLTGIFSLKMKVIFWQLEKMLLNGMSMAVMLNALVPVLDSNISFCPHADHPALRIVAVAEEKFIKFNFENFESKMKLL